MRYFILLTIFSLSAPPTALAQPFKCEDIKTDFQADICSIGYLSLAQLQAMQINEQLPESLSLVKLEQALMTGSLNESSFLKGKERKTKLAIANDLLKSLLIKTDQLDGYINKVKTLNVQMPNFSTTDTASTGTRGGGFGNESYILPDGFWLD